MLVEFLFDLREARMVKKTRLLLKKVFELLDKRERQMFNRLVLLLILVSILEVISISAIMPFMELVSDPDSIQRNQVLNQLFDLAGEPTTNNFLIIVGVLVLVALVFSNLFSAIAKWYGAKFGWMRHYSISRRLLEKSVSKDYEEILTRDTSEISNTILVEITHLISNILMALVELIATILSVTFVAVLLLLIEPVLSLLVICALGGAYVGIYVFVQRKLREIGEKRLESNEARFKIVKEAFSSIKDIKLLSKEAFVLNTYDKPSVLYAKCNVNYTVISQVPRYALELVAFGGVILITLYLLFTQESVSEVIPKLALFAFAGFRLMPTLQRMFLSITRIRFYIPTLNKIAQEASVDEELILLSEALTTNNAHNGTFSKPGINLKNIHYRYPNTNELVLKGLDVSISPNTIIGFVGATGSGKTTLIDVLLGLLKPEDGAVLVNGKDIHKHELVDYWQKYVGYVPQQIILNDSSIYANIAFGVEAENINKARVIESARSANIHDYIASLPNGYETRVGENGVRLSGGQRQRIGIARALYRNPSVLIMDEATSALDGITEGYVMDAIHSLGNQKTIILIAHRLTTLKECDVIYILESGHVEDKGTYHELMVRNQKFFEMANLN